MSDALWAGTRIELFGETDETEASFSQLSTLQLNIAKSQPTASFAILCTVRDRAFRLVGHGQGEAKGLGDFGWVGEVVAFCFAPTKERQKHYL